MFPRYGGTYIEPFLGSGAVFFHFLPASAILSDCNEALIEAYSVVRDKPEALHKSLLKMHALHNPRFYYEVRATKPSTELARAARFIYLNRTCWNGLYRVNRKGEFNVPVGTKGTVGFPPNALSELSRILKDAELVNVDFEVTIDRSKKGDFIFVDPPYTVSHNNNGFIKYNDVLFMWEDQIRLANAVHRASKRGVFVFVSNANHKELVKLYTAFAMHHTIERSSILSGENKGRRRTEEAAFLNYNPPAKSAEE